MSGNCATGMREDRDQARERDDDRDDEGEARPLDEDVGDHGAQPSAGGCPAPCRPARGRRRSLAATAMPGRTFWMPSTITLSPASRPRSDDHPRTLLAADGDAPRLRPCRRRRPPGRRGRPGRPGPMPAAPRATCSGSAGLDPDADELAIHEDAVRVGQLGPDGDGIGATDRPARRRSRPRPDGRRRVAVRQRDPGPPRSPAGVIAFAPVFQELALAAPGR